MRHANPRPALGQRSRRFRPSALVVLSVVWVLLWGRLNLFIVLTGVLLALAVGAVFPLPRIDLHGRFRPVGALRLFLRQIADLVRASLSVIGIVFRFGHTPISSIIAVPLRSTSELYLAQTAELVSLVPGTVVLEVRRSTSTLYVHVLDQSDPDQLAATAQEVLGTEERVLRAFGSDAEIAALDAGRPLPGREGSGREGPGPDGRRPRDEGRAS